MRAQAKHSAPVGCGSPVFSTSNSSPLHSRIRKFKQPCSAPTILGPRGDLLGKASALPAPWRLFIYTDVKQKPTDPTQPCSQPPCYKAVGSPTIFPEPCRYFSAGFMLLKNHQNNTAAVFARKSRGCNLKVSRLNLPGGGGCSQGGSDGAPRTSREEGLESLLCPRGLTEHGLRAHPAPHPGAATGAAK